MLHRGSADQTFQELPGTSANRWVLGGRFVEMTLRADGGGDEWSAVFYIGYERGERRHVLVSLEPGGWRITTRVGEWKPDHDRLVLTSHRSRTVCDVSTPGRLVLEVSEEVASGQEFVRLKADYRPAAASIIARPPMPREYRRFVIA
jgi:hypothetical protein